MKFDITLRNLAAMGSPALIGMITGARVVERLPTEFPEAKDRRVDTLVRLDNGRILHMEWQSGYHPGMPWRMLGYRLPISTTYPGVPVHQVVIQVGGTRLVADRLEAEGLSFRYRVLDSREQDPTPLLASPAVEDNVLAILFGAPLALPTRVRAILTRLAALDDRSRRDAVTQLLILAGLRNAAALVLEEAKTMPLQFEPITDPLFLDLIRRGQREGRAEGRLEGEARGEARGEAKGEAKALIRLAERRFGPLPADARNRILSTDAPTVEIWLDRLMDAPSLDAVLTDRPAN
jgi:predicted transposase YdaD